MPPPWVLFIDKGKPVEIMPAGRPGVVMDVGHLTMSEAQRIVRTANKLQELVVESLVRVAEATLEKYTDPATTSAKNTEDT